MVIVPFKVPMAKVEDLDEKARVSTEEESISIVDIIFPPLVPIIFTLPSMEPLANKELSVDEATFITVAD